MPATISIPRPPLWWSWRFTPTHTLSLPPSSFEFSTSFPSSPLFFFPPAMGFICIKALSVGCAALPRPTARHRTPTISDPVVLVDCRRERRGKYEIWEGEVRKEDIVIVTQKKFGCQIAIHVILLCSRFLHICYNYNV
ncbi:hypothetical protein AVEN_255089-1 [Araneus ventricosus]|uniref:Uncharacterized protein n=1 Tax=Araneus ventricosus TaxID=182803 RepID=A0A4Y2EDN0_ARAVE|nr:hypothetical protein AVEN_255089-1 [Araneus ventricosus]